jgi:hypothetical protein
MITTVVIGRYDSFSAVRKGQVYRNLTLKNATAGTNSQVHRSIMENDWRFSK